MGWLVVSRRARQRIHIGPDIKVELVKVFHGGAVLSVLAPDDVRVLREELVGVQEDPLRWFSNTFGASAFSDMSGRWTVSVPPSAQTEVSAPSFLAAVDACYRLVRNPKNKQQGG